VLSLWPLPEVTYWVGMTHETDHYELDRQLTEWNGTVGRQLGTVIRPAYDGLVIPL
jgi:hypothetical protein